MKTDLSNANEKLCAQLHEAVKSITRRLGRYLGAHDGYQAYAYNITGGTAWYYEDTGFTEIVLRGETEIQTVFEADPEGRATMFVEGPWIGEVLGLAKLIRKDAA
jgi:hypothetical protein